MIEYQTSSFIIFFNRISKATIKKSSNDTTRKPTIKENDSPPTVSKLFQKSKQLKIPSPLLMTISDLPNKTAINTSSSWSSSSNSDSPKHKKPSKHRSYVDSYDISKGNSTLKTNRSQPRKISNDVKSPAKSKLVLENVRKMIKDQNIQQQNFNHNQQKESARL